MMQRHRFGLADRFRVSTTSRTCAVTEFGTYGVLATIRLTPLEALELVTHLEAAVSELKARGNLGGAQVQDRTSRKAFPSLSQEYSDRRRRGTFAHCRGCNVTYWDDVPNYGSLLCPRCWEFVLVRGWIIGDSGEIVVNKAKIDNNETEEVTNE